jgi:hypothetical protein
MGFLILFMLVFLFASAVNRASKIKISTTHEEILPADPVCPPHKWFYKEIKNELGEVVKWKMVCEICGPLKPLNNARE